MTIDELDDLKQFMTALISQVELRLGERIDQLEERFDQLDNKVDRLTGDTHDDFAGIAEIVEDHNKHIDNHQERITKLEEQATLV